MFMGDLYLPIPVVEALGRAAVAISELELSFDILLTILSGEPGRYGVCNTREPFETKIMYLTTVPRSRLLKHQWAQLLNQTARRAKILHQEFSEATIGSVYSRGAGSLEVLVRGLAEKISVRAQSRPMTPGMIARVGQQAREQAQLSCELATSLLAAAERLSIPLSCC